MLQDYLITYGYSVNQINKIITNYEIQNYQETKLLQKIKTINTYLENIFKNKNIVIKATSDYPQLYGYDLEYLKNKYQELQEIGYQEDELQKMLINLPILLCYSQEKIKNKIQTFTSIGYSKENILKMTIKMPQLYGYQEEKLKFC